MDLLDIINGPVKTIGSMIFSANQNNRMMNNSWDMMKASQDWTTSEREAMQDYNTSEREAAQQYNTQMWQMNADYNSIGAQIARAKAAGVNPNSVLGDTAVASPVTTTPQSAPSGEVVNGQLPQLSDLGRLFAENINSMFNNMLTAQQTKTEQHRTILTEKEIARVMSDTELKNSMASLNDAQRKQIDELLPNLKGKTENEVKLIYQQAQECAQKVKLLEQQTTNAQKEESVIEADAQLKGMQAKEAKAHANLMSMQKIGQESENVILAAKADLAKQGVIVDTNWMQSLVTLLMSPDCDKVVSKVFENLYKGLGGAVEGASRGIGALFNSIKDWFVRNDNHD